MKNSVKKEIEKLIEYYNLNCSVEKFQDKVNWIWISSEQKLSENFIREFKDKVSWINISAYQQLSENFIREFKDKVNWGYISCYQQLSEDFIREFKDKVNWYFISYYQKLSENFIKEFKNKVDWYYISINQKLSENFIKEFKNKIYIKLYNKVNREISYLQKIEEVKEYCKKHNLEFDEKNKYFYAYRDHDNFGRGIYNKTIFYEKGKYYKDWHLDMRKDEENSFGLGIFPKGNTKVKILIENWGVEVNREDGKCRVWGFEII